MVKILDRSAVRDGPGAVRFVLGVGNEVVDNVGMLHHEWDYVVARDSCQSIGSLRASSRSWISP
jgi:hypothetical protein